MTYAITGATGPFGNHAINQLLQLKVPATSIIAIVRDQAKASGLKSLGVTVRVADYANLPALESALKGVDRLLLVSGSEVGQRTIQHQNIITAAGKSGVKLVVYTSIAFADSSTNPLAPEHKLTEAALKASKLHWVILRNNWYTENYLDDLRRAADSGIIAAAVGTGKVASASRTDYAEAAARVLVGEGHVGKTYELTGSAAWDYTELARTAGELLGRKVTFQNLTATERRNGLVTAGLPDGIADFVTSLDTAIAAGTLAVVRPDLEQLLGRKPLSLIDGLRLALK